MALSGAVKRRDSLTDKAVPPWTIAEKVCQLVNTHDIFTLIQPILQFQRFPYAMS
jgi:hypothetical protein